MNYQMSILDEAVGYFVGLNKVEALRDYKFSLSFENSNVEDYVTEKFFQALVAGVYCLVNSYWLHFSCELFAVQL